MAPLKNLFKLAVSLAAFAVCSNAQAEIITYSFTAEITCDQDSSNVLGVEVGETVTGTFSFDTDVRSTVRDGAVSDQSYQDTGTIETDVVVIQGGRDSVQLDGTTVIDSNYDIDGLIVADAERGTRVTNLSTGRTVNAQFAVESVTFYFGDADALSSTDLPESLNLDQFDGATYLVKVKLANGQTAYAVGDITSLSRVGGSAASVPELSASGAASSLAVLVGGAYVIVQRRREGAAS
jgi:hypothetical protein